MQAPTDVQRLIEQVELLLAQGALQNGKRSFVRTVSLPG